MEKEIKTTRKAYKVVYRNTTIKNKIIYGTVATILITTFIGTILSMNDIKDVAKEGLINHLPAH